MCAAIIYFDRHQFRRKKDQRLSAVHNLNLTRQIQYEVIKF